MNNGQPKQIDYRVYLGYLGAFLILLITGYLSLEGNNKILEKSGNAIQIRQSLVELKSIYSKIQTAEIYQRDFLLTGTDGALNQFLNIGKTLPNDFEKIRTIAKSDVFFLQRVSEMEALWASKLAEMNSFIKARQEGGSDAVFEKMDALLSSRIMQEITAKVDKIEKNAIATMEEADQESRSILTTTQYEFFAGCILAVIVILFALRVNSQSQLKNLETEEHLTSMVMVLKNNNQRLAEVINAQNAIATAALSISQIQNLIVAEAVRLTRAHGATIETVEGRTLVVSFVSPGCENLLGTKSSVDDTLSGASVKERRRLICYDTERDPRVNKAIYRKQKIRSVLAVPVVHGESGLNAVLQVWSREPKAFAEAESNSLEIIASLLAAQIAQKKAYAEKARAVAELEEVQKNLVIAKDEAERATQSKSDFLATMSHEIRNPLNGVLGMAGLLAESGGLNPTQEEYVRTIQRSGQSLLTLINDILDISKIEAGKLEFESVPFHIGQLIEDVQKSFQFAAKKKGLSFGVQVNLAKNPMVIGDPTRLTQVLNNLLGNALKFTQKGGVGLIVTAQDVAGKSTKIHFVVRDSGIGMSQEAMSRLFQKYSQAEKDTTRKFGGTGLGLSISKSLVEKMGGEIGARSKQGVGSEFFFTVEFKAGEMPKEVTQKNLQATTESSALRKIPRALIADDDSVNLMITQKMLERLGFVVIGVGNGVEVMKALEKSMFDIVFLDTQMPEMDGYQTAKQIRLNKNPVPIVAITGNAMTEDKQKCLQAGMNDHLAKPLTVKDLEAAIRKWLGLSSAVPSGTDSSGTKAA